jgi:hypothetical protein
LSFAIKAVAHSLNSVLETTSTPPVVITIVDHEVIDCGVVTSFPHAFPELLNDLD